METQLKQLETDLKSLKKSMGDGDRFQDVMNISFQNEKIKKHSIILASMRENLSLGVWEQQRRKKHSIIWASMRENLSLGVWEQQRRKKHSIIWASMRENLSLGVCEEQRCRSACASAQSDQHLCYSLFGKNGILTCYR